MLKHLVSKIFNKMGYHISRLPAKLSDEITISRIGNYDLRINGTHTLPQLLNIFPGYSANLPRIVEKISEKYSNLLLIDVGANIGDTVALVRSKVNCAIVCIEGDEQYFGLLKENAKQFINVNVYKYYLSDKCGSINASVEKKKGTLKVVNSNKNRIMVITLDNFIEKHPVYSSAKILKIDTDGYDMKIIRGAKTFIREGKPIIFFEYDRLLLEENRDDGISTILMLKTLGYNLIMFYDNYGRFILYTTLSNNDLIIDLHDYIKGQKSAFPYYDICIFHADDEDIAKYIIMSEIIYRRMYS